MTSRAATGSRCSRPAPTRVKFQLQGSARSFAKAFTLTPGFTSSLNIVMEVALVAETVTVVGESPIIDVTNAVVATNFSKELTAVLPTGHDVFSVLAITPGVQVTAPDVGGSRAGLRAQFRVFGSTSQWNVIEGAIMASLQYEDPDVYQEVQVAGASKGADAPVGGSFNNFIVKSGGNNIHGLVFYDREPLALRARISRRARARKASPIPARWPATSRFTPTSAARSCATSSGGFTPSAT